MQPEDLDALANIDSETLGRRLRGARQAAGMTQPDVGGSALSAAYLSRIERGQRRPSPALLDVICDRLGISVQSLLTGTQAPDPRALECELDFAELSLQTGDTQQAQHRVDALLSDARCHPLPHVRERALLVKAGALAANGLPFDALATYEEILGAALTEGGWIKAALGLSRLAREMGDLPRAAAVAEQALQRATADSHELDEVVRLSVTLAATLYEAGDIHRAVTICRQALATADASGSARARVAAYWNTAIIEAESGNLDEALRLARRALSLLELEEDARLYARLKTQLGELLLKTNPPELDEALKLFDEARELFRFTEADAADILGNKMAIARAHFTAGDLRAAVTEAQECLNSGTDLPFVATSAATLLGRIAALRADMEQAKTHYMRAIHYLTAAGSDRQAAQQWFNLATLLDEVGLDTEAKDAYRRAAASTGLVDNPLSAPVHH